MQSKEIPRIDLTEGAKTCSREIREKLNELTANLRRVLFVVINGAGISVGKSYVTSLVLRHMMESNIPSTHTSHDADDFSYALKQLKRDFLLNKKMHPGVIISDDTHYLALPTIEAVNRFREISDSKIKEASNGILEKIDLWIGVERPDKRFRDIPVADVLIHNLGAKNKPA